MAQDFKYTGIKISQNPLAEINKTIRPNKLEHRHYFMSYAATNYGIAEINKNYRISIDALRDDMIGFVGIQNSKPGWRDYIDIWEGDWYNVDKIRSYVYEWDASTEIHDLDFVTNKHGLDEGYDKAKGIHRIYMLKTAPWPLEATDSRFTSLEEKNYGYDPNPHSTKFVSKNYVDDRHSGFRKVDVPNVDETNNSSHLTIRPYTCFYQYNKLPQCDESGCYYIDIYDDCTLEDGTTFYDKVKHNRLVFYLRIKNSENFYQNNGVHCNNLKLLVNGKSDKVLWSYEDEWTELLREHRLKVVNGEIKNKQKEYIFLKCEGEYIDGTFTVTCSSFFGRKKAIKRMVEIEIPDNGIVDLDLSLHENECFVSQIPNDDPRNYQDGITRAQTVINLDVSKLNDYHMYSWDYFIITPDDAVDSNNRWDYNKLVFGKTPILWANDETYNISPEFQPNKMYCVEFVKAFDDLLIGRIKYYVSLIKKS